MKIRRVPLIFNDVLGIRVTCDIEEWFPYVASIRHNVILNNLYPTGPISYQIENVNEENDVMTFTFYQPVNAELVFDSEVEREEGEFFYQEELYFEDGLLIRCVEFDDVEDVYEILEQAAEQSNVKLHKPYLHMYINVYGDGMVDVYAPIIKETAND